MKSLLLICLVVLTVHLSDQQKLARPEPEDEEVTETTCKIIWTFEEKVFEGCTVQVPTASCVEFIVDTPAECGTTCVSVTQTRNAVVVCPDGTNLTMSKTVTCTCEVSVKPGGG